MQRSPAAAHSPGSTRPVSVGACACPVEAGGSLMSVFDGGDAPSRRDVEGKQSWFQASIGYIRCVRQLLLLWSECRFCHENAAYFGVALRLPLPCRAGAAFLRHVFCFPAVSRPADPLA